MVYRHRAPGLSRQGGFDVGARGITTYIDGSVLNSILSGCVILIGAIWAVYLFHRLWQQSLREQASGAIEAAGARGIRLLAPGFKAGLVAEGVVDGREIVVEWRGGPMGPRSRLTVNGEGTWGALIADEAALVEALDSADEV